MAKPFIAFIKKILEKNMYFLQEHKRKKIKTSVPLRHATQWQQESDVFRLSLCLRHFLSYKMASRYICSVIVSSEESKLTSFDNFIATVAPFSLKHSQ
jgi:hypothetical protein